METELLEEVQLSHIFFFADGSLVFCKATLEECQTLLDLLNIYQRASGQHVNYAKSAISFSKGMTAVEQEALIRLTGISKVGGFGRYLGLPERIGRRR